MALSRKLLTEGEREVLSIRTHVKVLTGSAMVLIVTCAATGFLLAVSRNTSVVGPLRILIGVLAVAVFVFLVLLPFGKWLAHTYTITNRRLVEQRGILTRTGRVIPWNRVNDIAFEKSLLDRIFGCGTLIIHDASEQSGLRLRDVPRVAEVHRTLTGLVFDLGSRRDRPEDATERDGQEHGGLGTR